MTAALDLLTPLERPMCRQCGYRFVDHHTPTLRCPGVRFPWGNATSKWLRTKYRPMSAAKTA